MCCELVLFRQAYVIQHALFLGHYNDTAVECSQLLTYHVLHIVEQCKIIR